MRVHLLGPLRLIADGDPFTVPTARKTLPLLVYLLLHRDRPLQREHLAFTMWPDADEDDARVQLRVNLHTLNRTLPKAETGYWIRSDAERVQWNPDAPLWLDVVEFEQLAASSQRREEAVALYGGDLAEALYDEWLVAPREHYRGIYVTALADLISEHRRLLEFDAAIACAQRLLAADPWREDIVRRLIALRYESGDGAGAVAEYTRFAQRLRAEMNIEPMIETVALRNAVTGGEGVAMDEPAAAVATPLPAQRGALPFVGRAAELDYLRDAWSRAARGRGGLVLISGDAGIGKSRLAMEFARSVDERGGRVVVGSTSAPEAMPYQCLVEALRSALPLVAALQLPPVSAAVLATLLPELRQRTDEPPPLQLEPDREQQRMFETIARSVIALAKPRPLLLLVEDLHWAQDVTLEAIGFIVRRLALSPVLVVATQREDLAGSAHPLRRLRRELQAEGLVGHVAPAPLILTEVGDLVERLADVSPNAKAEFSRKLLDRSEGNPLFLTHLVRAGAVENQTPSTLRPMIASTLERLSPGAHTMAEIAALVGETFSLEVLSDVSGWGEAEVAAAVEELIDRHIVRESAGRTLLQYAFTHQLVQAVVRDGAPGELTVTRHRRIARVMEQLYPERIDELAATLALHYERGGEAALAAERYHGAARRAVALGAIREARDYLSRGVELAEDLTLRINLLRERERLHGLAGDRNAQACDLDALGEIAESSHDDALHNDVLLRRVALANAIGDEKEQGRYLHMLRERIVEPERTPLGRAMLQAHAQWRYGARDFGAAREAAKIALAAHRAAGDTDAEIECLCLLAETEGNIWHERDAIAWMAEAQAVARSDADPRLLAKVLATALNLDIQIVTVDDLTSNLQRALDLRDLSVKLGDRRLEARALNFATFVLFDLRRYAESLACNDEVLAICEEIGNRRLAAIGTLWRVTAAAGFGAFDEARQLIARASRLYESINDLQGRAQYLAYASMIEQACGNIPLARRDAAGSMRAARQLRLRHQEAISLGQMACVEFAGGKLEHAIRNWERAFAHFQSDRRHMIARDLSGLALAYVAIGRIDAAAQCIDRMLAHWAYVEVNEFWPDLCQWVAAQVYKVAQRQDKSGDALRHAYRLMAECAERAPSEAWRASFLALPWHAEIEAAVTRDKWPDLQRFNPAPT